MSLRLNGDGKAYRLNAEIVKSPSTSSLTLSSLSSSPSSTLSESINSPLAVSIRKPRTPRKRLNQTYHEAAALLSTAYPNLFSSKNIIKPCNFSIPPHHSSEFLPTFRVIENSGILVHDQAIPEKPSSPSEPKTLSFCEKSVENHLQGNGCEEDFDAESLLDEEIEGGVDSIMGNLSMINYECHVYPQCEQTKPCYLSPPGLGFGGNFDLGFGMRGGVRAMREVDERDWWRFPAVEVVNMSREENKMELKRWDSPGGNLIPEPPSPHLLLKLNHQRVQNAWSDRGSPFSGEIPGAELAGNDVHARLGQIELFSEGGGLREASVLRYKEKRRTRLFSKKIRYQVRKVNADGRPRMKGRFVRRTNSRMTQKK